MLTVFTVDGKQRNLGIIHAHEYDLLAVWAPPIGLVAGGSSENLFKIYPAGIAIQDKICTIIGDAVFFS